MDEPIIKIPKDVEITKEAIDSLDERRRVECDEQCGAFEEPKTLEEYEAALAHWKYHPYLCGCSHGA